MRSTLFYILYLIPFVPALVYGQTNVYAPLVGIPGNAAGGFDQYISFLYGASISVAALLAVVKIIIAGAKYMLSDIVSSKGDAISDIQGAVLGLLLILGAVIILEFINPQLIKGNVQFQTIPAAPKINAATSVAVNPDGSAKDGVVVNSITTTNIQNWTRSGNIVTVAFDTTCQAEVASRFATAAPGAQQSAYNTCAQSVEGQTRSYCKSNYGIFTSQKTTYTCKLPTAFRNMNDFTAEFEAYKATLPANNYAGRGATSPSNAVQEILCKQWGGVFIYNYTVASVCVKYN